MPLPQSPTMRGWRNRIFRGLPALLCCASAVGADPITELRSAKRGLAFTPNSNTPQDNYIWPRSPSDLTWYYNYGAAPSPVYGNLSQAAWEFVPMLWGAPSDPSDTSFLSQVKTLVKTNGINVTNVLTFNEPDGPTQYGGSNVDPTLAAQVWVNNIIPLQQMGIRAGLPACTGGESGIPWTQEFLANCSKLISTSDEEKNCTYDFMTLHWYGNFGGLASHIGEWYAAFNSNIWITEYNYDNQDLATTQDFFNSSLDYFDRLPYVERYSLFGAFRSSVSNVGPNAAMLSAGGSLTDIGAWYLGEQATGVLPTSLASSVTLPLLTRTAAAAGLVVLLTFLLGS